MDLQRELRRKSLKREVSPKRLAPNAAGLLNERERWFLLEGRLEKDGGGLQFFWNVKERAGEEERLRNGGKRRRRGRRRISSQLHQFSEVKKEEDKSTWIHSV